MSSYDPLSPDGDPFGPPAVPTLVGCIHCGQAYESYLIEWRITPIESGELHGFWCCPIPGCDGKGFGFDILPVDPDYQDERGGWVHDDDDDDEDWEDVGNEPDSAGTDSSGAPPDDQPLPW